MASGLSPTAPGGSPPLSERRIVLLGKAGAGKHRVARVILENTKLNEESEECVLHEGEQEGRRICIVDTPGWDQNSIEFTTKKVKDEISWSVTLCPPGPHALILVLPVNTGEGPSVIELKSASQHMELLSERVWEHTMVLFLCDENVEESTIKDHFKKAGKLLKKCSGRHYVLRQSEFVTQDHRLLKEIDSMLKENPGHFFLSQVSSEEIQSKMAFKEDTQTETTKTQGEEKPEAKDALRQRRGSLQGARPTLSEQTENSGSQKETKRAKKDTEQDELPWNYIKPIVVILMAFMGALLGSVAGSQYGTMGAVVGIVIGFVVLMLISVWLICLIS